MHIGSYPVTLIHLPSTSAGQTGLTGFYRNWFNHCKTKVKFYLRIQSAPRSKHSVSAIKTNQLMLHREIIAVCYQIHTKHIT
jgi:hypothetical protein